MINTPWVDTCTCCDAGLCRYHAMSDDPIPVRPSDEVMRQRTWEMNERLWEEVTEEAEWAWLMDIS